MPYIKTDNKANTKQCSSMYTLQNIHMYQSIRVHTDKLTLQNLQLICFRRSDLVYDTWYQRCHM